MADEAFALSPISARATLPSEEDYDAIREAFMETSRGRWFLGEYAKRNRNADTRLVLDAVARIEETIAAQKQPPPPPDNGLAEALAAIRSALDEARAAASSAIGGLDLEQHLGPVRKGARIIREISWRLREIGADGRICDLINSQLSAIETACGDLATADQSEGLSAAFDRLETRIGEIGAPEAASSAPQPLATQPSTPQTTVPAAPSPAPVASDEMPGGAIGATLGATTDAPDTTEVRTADANDAGAATGTPAMPAEAIAATIEAAQVNSESADATAQAADGSADPGKMTAEAAAAYDDALLDLVALEMAAPDPLEIDEIPGRETAQSSPADPEITARKPKAAVASTKPATAQASMQVSPQPALEVPLKPTRKLLRKPSREASLEPTLEPSLEPSLGATILATGIVQRPKASPSDPLAPIRRLSQAEKIAFFS